MTAGLEGHEPALCSFCPHREELQRLKARECDGRTTIETFVGEWVDYADLDPATIKLADIARSLSQTARYNGMTPYPWSVADHALLVRKLVIEDGYPELALGALHHDSHEYLLLDWPTPLKNRIKQVAPGLIAQITDEVDQAIGESLNINPEDFHAEPVKEADQLALRIEAFQLKPSKGMDGAWPYRDYPPKMRTLVRRHPDETAQAFIDAHIGHYQPIDNPYATPAASGRLDPVPYA